MKRIAWLSLSSTLAVSLASFTFACAKSEPRWACESVDVPAGQTSQCSINRSALTDATAADEGGFDCLGDDDPRCPPPDADPTPTTGTGDDAPSECGYVDDLPYCPPPSEGSSSGGAGTGSSTSSSSSTGGTTDGDCGKKKCPPPGSSGNASSGNGSSGASGGSSSGASGGSSSGASGGSSSGGGGGGGGGGGYHCVDDDGVRVCTRKNPRCPSGYKPARCGACLPTDSDEDECRPPSAGGCFVTGGGFIVAGSTVPSAAADGKDNFGGNAKVMKSGRAQGHWNHVDHGTGHHLKGRVAYVTCAQDPTQPGPGNPGGKKGFAMNIAYFGGPAEYDEGAGMSTGFWYDVEARDHGEPGARPAAKSGGTPDAYVLTVRKGADPNASVSGVIVYQVKGSLEGGNIQIHPGNGGHPSTSIAVPPWVAP